MKKILSFFNNNYALIYKGLLFISAVVVLMLLFPSEAKFKYEYSNGKPWMYKTMIAPFDFPVYKTNSEIEKEEKNLLKRFTPYFFVEESVENDVKKKFESSFDDALENNDGLSGVENEKTKTLGIEIIDDIYKRGILLVNEDIEKKSDGFIIRLVKDNIALKFKIGDLFTVKSADEYSKKVINASDISTLKKAMLLRVIQKSIEQNIFYDEQKSKDAKKELLSDISLTRGMVQKGEKIIAKGEVVTQQSYRNLKSLEKDFSMRLGENYSSKFIYLGHGILIVVMMMIFFIYIFFFRKDVYEENKKIVLILFVILMIVMLTSFTSQYNPDFLYIVPIAILPILIRAFFDARLAIYVHLIAVMIFGFIVPDSFNFVVMQIVAGIVAVVSIFNLHRRAQFFITSFFIMISYFVVYTGLHLLGQGSFENYQYTDLVLLAGSAVLSLFAYPLIYIFEKVFGIVTDVTLLELSDTNGKLLRRLAVVAPGTFHHSNQVAILAEEAIREIGGNALLVRAGALYHDIGKMDTPIFFTENQSNGINPHDDLSNEESSRIIRSHVIKGVELAKKNNLPEQLIDFIRTHHGTRKTEYFYVRQKLDNPDEGLSEKNYTYHGPIPFSKETAVLMIADSVEAASKSMTAPDEQKISALVESVVAKLFESNQLMNADITLRDIRAVKKILKRQLMNIYHLRIEYPD